MRPLLLVLALGACSDDVARPSTDDAGHREVAPTTLPAIASDPIVQFRLISPGSPPRRVLRFSPKPGARHTLSLAMTLGMDMTSGQHRMMSQEGVTRGTFALDIERAAAGEIVMALTVVELDVPAWGPTAKPPDLGGKRGTIVVSDRGELRSADLPFRQDIDEASGMFELADWIVLLPDEPVGQGAIWEVSSIGLRNGLTIEVVERHTLVELDGTGGRTTYVQEQRIAPQHVDAFAPDPVVIVEVTSGSSTGAGELRFTNARPLPVASSMQFDAAYAMQTRAPTRTQPVSMTMKARFQATSN